MPGVQEEKATALFFNLAVDRMDRRHHQKKWSTRKTIVIIVLLFVVLLIGGVLSWVAYENLNSSMFNGHDNTLFTK